MGVTPSTAGAQPGGTVTTHRLGPLCVTTTESGPVEIPPSAQAIGRPTADDHITVLLQASGRVLLDQSDRQTPLGPGCLVFTDTNRPYTLIGGDRSRTHAFRLPQQSLGLREADRRRVAEAPVPPDTEIAALVVPFLSRLADRAGAYEPHLRPLLARNAADLLATLAAERLAHGTPRAGTDTAGTLLRLRIKGYVEDHLTDPDLTPRTIAAAHHISVRHVHRLFQAEGTTVGRWIRHRRLEACRRALGRPARDAPVLTAIAHRFGFTSYSHFSRAFRAAYGMSPSEWRGRLGV
ncbi:helix-turn-helix domain-containing protein [Streptomyces sp. NBC_00582]|uniref:helix-turn-helix domain-containing protein n=1 Tax=Streptomyces sp. NBC_00582 TaxID=2975783 RepID=UPI002E816C0D|nr:helix-turn-helix domain-containing protein [Streptomyces sp. NBC_00582]WUB66404.1 helix-turn-helix domain-containing protein [Streptomyces sp. NBC_00582]